MKLYNTLTREVEELKPLKPGEVSLYTCGPTVYDYTHIGHAFSYVAWDTLRRVLEIEGHKVKHVMNITDVGHLVSDADEGEDKLEKGAKRSGKTVWEVAEYYTETFKRDMRALNVLEPNTYKDSKRGDSYARATDFIPQQLEMVRLLLEKGYAYKTKQAIYFDITKLASYGELSGQKLVDKEVAVRSEVVTDPAKRHPFDFAVWFFTVGHFADHAMRWESSWGKGFPGWHLECSAIIHATLGDPIDIHTGGIDHIGTHHTNEMAQTEAAYGHQLANCWLHNNFILVDGAKMSKSKQNFYTIKDLTDKDFSPLAYRLMVLQSHYRSELNFTWESLQAAQNRLKEFRAMADLRWQVVSTRSPSTSMLSEAENDIKQALRDDLNTPQALAILSDVAKQWLRVVSTESEESLAKFLTFLDTVFGLNLTGTRDLTKEQEQLIQQREASRQARDWDASDKLRATLADQGIAIEDTQTGPIWRRA